MHAHVSKHTCWMGATHWNVQSQVQLAITREYLTFGGHDVVDGLQQALDVVTVLVAGLVCRLCVEVHTAQTSPVHSHHPTCSAVKSPFYRSPLFMN